MIGVTGAFNHSITLIIKRLEARDCVIGKKATIWVQVRADDKFTWIWPNAADNLEPKVALQWLSVGIAYKDIAETHRL